MTRNRFIAASLAFCLLAVTVAPVAMGQSAPSLRERMGAAQFHAAGLDKLTPQELARLDAWLREHPPAAEKRAASTTPAPAAEPGTPWHKPKRVAVTSRIDGVLHGWSGKTVFRLENGQVWEQRGYDSWSPGKTMDHPKVVIKPASFGSWLLKVGDYNATTRVKRIK